MHNARVLDSNKSYFYQLQQVLEVSTERERPELLAGRKLSIVSRELANMHWKICGEQELTNYVKIAALVITVFLALASLVLFQWTFGSILFHAVVIATPAYIAYEASLLEKAQTAALEVCQLLHSKLPLKKRDQNEPIVFSPILDRRAAPGSVVAGLFNSLFPPSPEETQLATIGTIHGQIRKNPLGFSKRPLLTHLERNPQIQKLQKQKGILDGFYILPYFLNASIQEDFTLEPSQGNYAR